MNLLALPSFEDDAVLRSFDRLLGYRWRFKAAVIAHLAEIDARHLYLREGFESMKSYCMAKLELTEDAAYKRLQIARLAKRMPRLFTAIVCGELSIYDVRLLASRLTPANVDTLVAECAHKSTEEIEQVLACRFPRAEELKLNLPQPISHDANGRSAQLVVQQHQEANPLADRQVDIPEALPPIANTPKVRTRVEPISATRYTLQVTLSGETHDKLRRLQDLLGHAVPNRDVAEVIDRSFDALIVQLEKRKFGVGTKAGRSKPATRSISAQIKKAVFDRDGGRCAHRFEDGRVCRSTSKVEFDHVVPVAKGGRTTIENVRLLCRAHNQYAAEQEFGRAFMDRKRATGRPFSGARAGSRKG